MMARKLSRFARRRRVLLAAVAVLTSALFAAAEEKVGVEVPPSVVNNPFSGGGAAPVTVPEEPDMPRTAPTTYSNPFARLPMAPRVAPPLRPGPISRWQRFGVLADDASTVKTAILSTNPATSKATWDQLPPAENPVVMPEM